MIVPMVVGYTGQYNDIFTINMPKNGLAWPTAHARTQWLGEAQRADTTGRKQDAPSWKMTAHRTSRQTTDTRTHESHPGTPTPRGDTHRHRHAHARHRHSDRTMIAAPSSPMHKVWYVMHASCSVSGRV